MMHRISLITIFVLLNLGVGRLFQESNQVVCFSELSIIAITGFCFWAASAGQIRLWGQKWKMDARKNNLFIHGGIGLSAATLNLFFSQALVVFLMTTVHGCTTPTFNLLDASLTNNIAVNLLCYFALVWYSLEKEVDSTSEEPLNSAENPSSEHIVVTKKDATFLLAPDDVFYVETSNNCIVLHTQKGVFVKYQSLKAFMDVICPERFVRVHRSYLVNSNCIERIVKNRSGDGNLLLSNGDTLKFSRNYKKAFA